MWTMEADCQTRIDVLKNIIESIHLDKDRMDFWKIPGLKKEFDRLCGCPLCGERMIGDVWLPYTVSVLNVLEDSVFTVLYV